MTLAKLEDMNMQKPGHDKVITTPSTQAPEVEVEDEACDC